MKTINGVLEIQNKMVVRGKTIKLLRIIKDTTLKQMEEETGISISVLSAMENEVRSVSSVNQLKVTKFLLDDLGYTPDEIVVIQSFITYKEGFKDGKGQS
ncbi:helix-turn-helix domain-containing protein [Priestia megaterium]|uniref:helix-turn-helix domain-containing protein n=1 Tax=Priestia megaterium TaxID=1404 RepID=UPI001BEB3082|nr:helix-turn-helix domain-containing protein [Priestia megaterium]MBT2257062.1 helix-turn-helix transcriptional regulator [Priestia megaterium]MBT2276710.1 helix-turn-helix transcriptional regulator [Priestia megaterium]